MDKNLTPEQRSLRARLAAQASWANTTDRSARTAAARTAALARFEEEVDPEGVLPPQERARRAASARQAYFTRLALRSVRARRCLSRHGAVTGLAYWDVESTLWLNWAFTAAEQTEVVTDAC